ncbi:MAG: nucleoside deaminase, partial [Alphaproteobacteria bacterium]|nr:nucleoside deaminase [Alphaproteobacteria bacterium]
MNSDERLLSIAVEESSLSVNEGSSPFGAVVVKDGKIISRAHNTVVLNNDPTAHAEINAIRVACKKLKTFDLSGCVLYTSCEPCPMCLSA